MHAPRPELAGWMDADGWMAGCAYVCKRQASWRPTKLRMLSLSSWSSIVAAGDPRGLFSVEICTQNHPLWLFRRSLTRLAPGWLALPVLQLSAEELLAGVLHAQEHHAIRRRLRRLRRGLLGQHHICAAGGAGVCGRRDQRERGAGGRGRRGAPRLSRGTAEGLSSEEKRSNFCDGNGERRRLFYGASQR